MHRAMIGRAGLLAVNAVISGFAIASPDPLPQRAGITRGEVPSSEVPTLARLGYDHPYYVQRTAYDSCEPAKRMEDPYPQSSSAFRRL